MKVTLVAQTLFHSTKASLAVWKRTGGKSMAEEPDSGVWINLDDGSDAGSLSEFAGRLCYESWTRPNPETATTGRYIGHIIDVRHTSVLEHGSVTILIEDVSRSCTHELVRHRHFSYSQLSQRFVVLKRENRPGDLVPVGQEPWVVPPLFRNDDIAATILQSAWNQACDHYDQLLERAEQLLDIPGMTGTEAKKRAREAARAVLPNMTPTAIVVTGNHTAWREAIAKRARLEADAEIRELFIAIFRQLARVAPELYQDMAVMGGDDGREWVAFV